MRSWSWPAFALDLVDGVCLSLSVGVVAERERVVLDLFFSRRSCHLWLQQKKVFL